jgi:hypothetical protein
LPFSVFPAHHNAGQTSGEVHGDRSGRGNKEGNPFPVGTYWPVQRDRGEGFGFRGLSRRRFFLPPRGKCVARFAPRARGQQLVKRRPASRQGEVGGTYPTRADGLIAPSEPLIDRTCPLGRRSFTSVCFARYNTGFRFRALLTGEGAELELTRFCCGSSPKLRIRSQTTNHTEPRGQRFTDSFLTHVSYGGGCFALHCLQGKA